MNVGLEIGYLGIEVPDPQSMTSFFGEVIGLVPGEPTPAGDLTWRNDEHSQRVIVSSGGANDATFVGFEAADGGVLDATIARLSDAGHEVTEVVDGEMLTARRVERLVQVTAPWGTDVEIATGLATETGGFSAPLVPGGFHTDGVGLGHVVFATTAFDESHAFLVDGLGFGQSDWLEMEIAEGIVLEVRFYHCNPRHHTVALARAPFDLPQVLHHVMFETNDRDDVGAAFDRAWESGLPIPNGLGRHDNDEMFSFYVQSPAGFLVEVGHGAREVGDDWDDYRRYDRISVWGHQPLRQP